MLIASLLIVLQALAVAPSDTAFLSGDTLHIAPMGLRLTVPSFWMGRIPSGTTPSAPGGGRFGCQLMERSTLSERIVTDRAQLSSRSRGRYGPKQVFDLVLDSIVPGSALVAHVGAVPFARNCVAPHVRIYVADTVAAQPSAFARVARRVIERQYSGIKSVTTDSAGWTIVRLAWTEAKTDFIRPAALDIWSRRMGGRLVILGVMEFWAGKDDTAALLNSIR